MTITRRAATLGGLGLLAAVSFPAAAARSAQDAGAIAATASFSPDGRRVVTASGDKTVRIWDVESGKEMGELKGHEDAVVRSSFSPDGRQVAASGGEMARLWDVFRNTQELVAAAEAATPRCLTLAQRQAFFLSPEPPAWCIKMEKWPYDTPAWKQWLAEKPAVKNPPLPTLDK